MTLTRAQINMASVLLSAGSHDSKDLRKVKRLHEILGPVAKDYQAMDSANPDESPYGKESIPLLFEGEDFPYMKKVIAAISGIRGNEDGVNQIIELHDALGINVEE